MGKTKSLGPYQVLESKSIYQNRWLSLREDSVLREDGTSHIFGVVNMKPGSTVLALTSANEVLLVREFKYGVERETLELISGAIEEGESPLDAAKRELREETGFLAAEWVDLGVVDPFTTVIRSPNHMFLARGLTEVGGIPDEGEVLEAIKSPFDEVLKMVMGSEITHAASCLAILKAAVRLGK